MKFYAKFVIKPGRMTTKKQQVKRGLWWQMPWVLSLPLTTSLSTCSSMFPTQLQKHLEVIVNINSCEAVTYHLFAQEHILQLFLNTQPTQEKQALLSKPVFPTEIQGLGSLTPGRLEKSLLLTSWDLSLSNIPLDGQQKWLMTMTSLNWMALIISWI